MTKNVKVKKVLQKVEESCIMKGRKRKGAKEEMEKLVRMAESVEAVHTHTHTHM